MPRWLGGDDDPSPPVEEPTETVPAPPTEHDDAQNACTSNDSAASQAEAVNQCGPGSPFSSNYADSFSEAYYDPKTDSIYARYDEQGVTVRYPLSSVQSEPCSSEGDAYAMATGRDQNGIFVPGLLNAHTAPRLAKLAGEAREWKQAWENADAATKASLELVPIVGAYGGQGFSQEAPGLAVSTTAARRRPITSVAELPPATIVQKPRIHMGQQGKHVPGHPNHTDPNRSVFTHPDPQALLDRFAGRGQSVNRVAPGQPGFKERVTFGEVIGEYRDPQTGQSMPTTKGIIHYGSKGAHIVPASP